MSSESRSLPNSNSGRMRTLDAAGAKNTAMGVGTILTNPTKARLVSINVTYRSKFDLIGASKHDMALLTSQKSGFAAACKKVCSHFIQVFNLAIDRGIFVPADRAFYKLDITTGNVPDMNTDEDIIEVAKDLIKGESDRTNAGGIKMTMPDIQEVQVAFDNLNNIVMPHSTAVDAYDQAQENLNALNTEADAVIKKVWDEVETFYNEESPASQRQNARQWGVIYVQVGSPKTITGTVRDATTNELLAGASVFFSNGNKTATSGLNGTFELNTTLMNDQEINAEDDLYNDYTSIVTLVENENATVNILMVKV